MGRLLRYSSPTLSLVPFSHSSHSHASPSTIFILFRASFFPFSRFSLHLFCFISCLFLHALFLSVVSSRTLNLYFHPCLRYRINPSLFCAILFSFHFGRQRQNKSFPTEGINENRLVEAIIGRTRVQEAEGVANCIVVGASIVTVLNERPWQSVSFPATENRGTQ